MNYRYEVLNALIKKYDFKTYLEIGIQNGINYNHIDCKDKTGVDPAPMVNDRTVIDTTSDNFFKINTKSFDLIFIDGLHHSDQVLKDINNSMKCLNKGGIIVLHDCNPQDYEHQVIPLEASKSSTWNGDCWKAFVQYRCLSKYEMYTVDIDHGMGIINTRKKATKSISINGLTDELTYDNLTINRQNWLNLKSVEEFKELLNGN